MQFSSILAATLLSTAAMAAPARRAAAKSMAAADNAQWTFDSVSRVCNGDDTSCTWNFGIDAGDGSAATPCSFTVTGAPASQAPGSATCGSYTLTSGWSGQFGPGFTVLAVKNANLIAYPSYTDAELASGQAVSPDRSYPVQTFQQ